MLLGKQLYKLKCLRTLQFGNNLEFHFKSNCFLLFSRNSRHSRVFCRHDEVQKDKTQYSKNVGNTAHYRILVVYSHDRVVDGEFPLAATAQLHERVAYYSPRKRSTFKIWSMDSTKCISLSPLQSWKIICWIIVSWTPSAYYRTWPDSWDSKRHASTA